MTCERKVFESTTSFCPLRKVAHFDIAAVSSVDKNTPLKCINFD